MKKFLSLVLALAMIISCVSMVSFTANAEEATEPVGIRITAKAHIASSTYLRKAASSASNALFAESDIVWDDSTATDTGDVRRTGYIYRNYKLFNDGATSIKFQIYYQGGNRGASTYGWDSIGGVTGASTVSVDANASTAIKIAIPVYELADGGIAVKITATGDNTSIYTATDAVFADGTSTTLSGYAPYWTISARFQFDANCLDANDTFVVIPEDKDDPTYLIAQGGNITLEKVYELPVVKFGDGTLEESTLGWGTIHNGTFSAVADPAEETNTVAKLTPSGAYHSIFFDFGPYIFNDPDLFYAGNGAGAYKISFKYKAESLEGYEGNAKFNVAINSQNHLNASQVKVALPNATYTHDTYYFGQSITMTEAWQTYTETFTFDQAYDMLVDLRHNSVANTADQSKTYQFGLRLDGGSNAFKNAQFNYFIDDVTIEYVGTKLGVATEITADYDSGAYPYWRHEVKDTGFLNESMAVDNVITLAYDVYNIGETEIMPDIQIQNGWSSTNCPSDKKWIAPKSMNTYTIEIKTDGNGNYVKADGTVVCALSALTFRMQYDTSKSRAAGSSFVVAPKNDLSASILYAMSKTTNKGGTGNGAATAYDYIGTELPDYVVVTPTPVPTPTPKAVSNGDVENGTTNWSSFLAGGTFKVVEEEGNHVASYLPAGQYATLGFDVGPYIVQDADDYFFGNGAGTYTVTFRAKAEAGQGGQFLLYINSLWHQNTGATIGGYELTGNTYQQGNPRFEMTDDWQTFTVDVDITKAFLENLYNAAAQADAATKAKIYQLNLRFDGSNKAFKVDGADNYFTYYVDDVTISYAPPATPTPTPTPKPTPAGLKLTSKTGLTAATYYNGGKLAAATGFTGTKEYTYKIHNVADQAVNVQMSVQTLHNGGWHAAAGSTTTVTIPAESFMIVTSTATVTDGKVVVSGTEYDLSACWIRVNQTYSAGAQEGDGIIIEALDGDPIYSGSGLNVTKSEVYELPVYTPHELVNGDVSLGEVGETTIEGWTVWNGGTNTIVQDPANENNKVVRFDPTGVYSTTGFKVAPVVYNDGIRYHGNGIGVYTITLRARLADASFLEGLDAATVTKATAFDVSLCGTKVYNHNGESNSYNTNSKRIQLTGDWQTFTLTIPVRDNNYNGWIAAADAANVFVRLDASGAGRAFGYTGAFAAVPYLIDDVTIEYNGVMSGYLFDTGSSTSYYITSGSSVFTAADVVNNYITSSQTIYNPNDFDITVEYCVQAAVRNSADTNNTWTGYSSETTIQPGQKATLTVKVPVDADGKAVIANSGVLNGSQVVDLSALFMRFNVNEGEVKQNTQFVVEAKYQALVGTKFSSWNKGYVGITPDFNIVGADLELGSTLTLNYYASLGEGYEDAFMNFVRNGQTTSVEGVLVEGGEYDGLYKFAYTGINPQAMGDNVEAYLVLDGQNIAVLKRYSVKDYALNMYGTKNNAELDTLIADMLAYGAASQEYTGYNDDALVTADKYAGIADWTFSEFKAPASIRKVEGNTDADARVYSVGMNISNVYKLYFKLEIADDANVTVKLNGEEVAVDGGVVYTDAIKATGNATEYKLELVKDGTTVSTVTYSVDSYIATKYTSEAVGAIVKAISNYGVSAYNYAN